MPAKTKANSPLRPIRRSRPLKQLPTFEGEEALRFLRDSGGLFQINRNHFHVCGFVFALEERGGGVVPVVIDIREQPEMCVFSREKMETSIAKVRAFQAENHDITRVRKRRLGYVRQPDPAGVLDGESRVG